MLDIILTILSVLGIVLLVLVLLLLAVLLLVLFFPVTYRFRARKESGALLRDEGQGQNESADKDGEAYRNKAAPFLRNTELYAGLSWLFGLLRVRYSYPETGALTVKLLCFKLYEAKLPPDGGSEAEKDGSEKESKPDAAEKISGEHADAPKQGAQADREPEGSRSEGSEQGGSQQEKQEAGRTEEQGQESGPSEANPSEEQGQESGPPAANPSEEQGQESGPPAEASNQEESRSEDARGGLLKKFQKIKYTICNIYDKIRGIWKNISYYSALLQEENTKQLYSYAKLCAAKILKNIRPRHIRADILFGTGSPDTTGYVFGLYCMLYPALGAKCVVTPDFERAVLEGRADISGHITVFVLGINVLRLMLDKKLRRFIRKLKKEDAAQDKNDRSFDKKAPRHKKAS